MTQNSGVRDEIVTSKAIPLSSKSGLSRGLCDSLLHPEVVQERHLVFGRSQVLGLGRGCGTGATLGLVCGL